jgi:hypothetical protein
MKKIFFPLALLMLLLASSCQKDTNNGSSWTFNGKTYDVQMTDTFHGEISYINESVLWRNQGPIGEAKIRIGNSLRISFGSGHLPVTSATFVVADRASGDPDQVTIYLDWNDDGPMGGTPYQATGGNGHDQTVRVTVSPAGSISVSGSGIMMRRIPVSWLILATQSPPIASDSSLLDFNVTQLN